MDRVFKDEFFMLDLVSSNAMALAVYCHNSLKKYVKSSLVFAQLGLLFA
jgi:hypothetical protein